MSLNSDIQGLPVGF